MKFTHFLVGIIFLVSYFAFVPLKEVLIKEPVQLTVSEGFKNPIGFYNANPTFSWKLPVLQNVKYQTAYQLVAASKPSLLPNNADLWNSEKQVTSQSTFIKYQGKSLQSRQKVYWQVRYWNQEKNVSEWSTINSFELGLLNNTDWKAKWTGLDTAKDSIKGVRNFLMHRPQYLRKQFKIESKITSARLYITAKGVFDVHLNGKDVSNDVMPPGWTPYDHRIETLTYDVTEFLEKGKNAFAVALASGWHSGRISRGTALYENFASPKILCQLEITLDDGSKQIVVSDKTWKGTTKGPVRLASIYDGEMYDANLEMPNWATAAFNDSSWQPVEVQPIDNSVKLVPKRHSTVKTQTVIDDVQLVSSDKNRAIFNLQQNIVGVPSVKVPMQKGDTLKIRFSEMLLKDGTFYTKNYRSAHSTDYYVAAKNGIIEYTPKFTFHGFQYVVLSGFDKNVKPKPEWVQGLAQHSEFEQTGTFIASHQKLNQLQQNITWGLRDNFFDIPTDCPQRDERLGWTGDAQVIAPTALFNYDTHSFWTAWLQSLRENQSEHEDGLVPFIVPDVLQRKSASSGWGDAATIIPWDIYQKTGDVTVLEESYEAAKKWVSHYQSKVKDKPYIPHTHSFADWLQPFPNKSGKTGNRGDTPKVFINTAFFAHSAHLVSKMASVLGKKADEEKYIMLYRKVAKAFENEFFDTDGKYTGKVQTQTSYLLAIYFDLLSPKKKKNAQHYLVEEIKKADNHLRTGFLGTPILPKVLDAIGKVDLMYEILFKETYPSWFYSINQGATTMWERWNSYSIEGGYNKQPMNSLNHYAYGAIGQWMYERIAGLSSLEPGYQKIKIAPAPNSKYVTAASASLQTPYGKVVSSWKLAKDSFTLHTIIPPNTRGVIYIPNGFTKNILLDGKPIERDSQINSKGDFVINLNAGEYKIKTKLK